MKYSRLLPVAAILSALAFIACEEGSSIGSSIVSDQVEIIIDSAFTVTGRSVSVTSVTSRSEYQLLGRIDAKGYGYLATDFASGFMPSNKLTTGHGMGPENVDSIRLAMVMRKGQMVGDSVMPLGLEVFRLNKPLPTSGLASDSPVDSYYDPSAPIASTIYNATVVGLPDSIAADYTYSSSSTDEARVVYVKLPREMGQDFYRKYLSTEGPALFNDPEAFQKWFPGLYVKNSYGSGRIMRFENSAVYLYLSYQDKTSAGKDTTIRVIDTFMAITPEVVLNNRISQKLSPEIEALASEKPVVVGPIGYDTEIRLPVKKIVESYKSQSGNNNVVNNLTFHIPASAIANDYDIDPPANILLVKKDNRTKFFENNSLTDNATSFYATYNSTTKMYSFTNMRQFAIDAIEKDKEGTLTDADGDYVLTPVNLVTETVSNGYYSTSQIVIAITPYIDTPAMVQFDLTKTHLYLTFSKQTMH
ncbi:DUF4270 family protein [uncultured Muribaculum sp.]|uniref:DUF4270 family protein n=1 Tax=uncultured Muribaculum sp. TaxID=1918613 RepID=UPI0025CEB686|nr:DUF4270 family protein [uncultured Muribaculum sp.]